MNMIENYDFSHWFDSRLVLGIDPSQREAVDAYVRSIIMAANQELTPNQINGAVLSEYIIADLTARGYATDNQFLFNLSGQPFSLVSNYGGAQFFAPPGTPDVTSNEPLANIQEQPESSTSSTFPTALAAGAAALAWFFLRRR